MQAPKVANFTGQKYGVAAEQAASQQAVPIAAPSQAVPGPQATAAPQGPAPGTLGGLTDPTARPNEPLTAGLATGPGPGPEGLRMDPDAEILDQLRALYRRTGSPALLRLIESSES